MYELEKIQKALEAVATMRARVDVIAGEEHIKELRLAHGESARSYRFGEMYGAMRAGSCDAAYALKALPETIRQVTRLERLAEAMHNGFDVSAYEDSRELRLLELLATNDAYRSIRRTLAESISEALGEVEEAEIEMEYESAIEALTAAGFVHVDRDDFEGLERGDERVVTEIARKGLEFIYGFSYEVSGHVEMEGSSGEFGKLLTMVRSRGL